MLFFAAAGCGKAPPAADVSGGSKKSLDSFWRVLESSFSDIEKGCRNKSKCLKDKAIDYIEHEACRSGDFPHAFDSVHDCGKEALKFLDGFLEGAPKKRITRSGRSRRRRSRSRRSSGGGSSPPPPPPFSVTPAPQPAQAPSIIAGFCDRSPGIADSIIAALSLTPAPTCRTVAPDQLGAIITLVVTTTPRPASGSGSCGNDYSSLRAGDFASLPNLKKIVFGGESSGGYGCINSVHEDTFSGLSKLEEINWGQQPIASFPADTFRNLPKLKKISLPECHDESVDPSLQNLPQSPMEIVADC